jgi:hypothetical protein
MSKVVIQVDGSSENVAWHALETTDGVLDKLGSSKQGLSSAEAKARLAR